MTELETLRTELNSLRERIAVLERTTMKLHVNGAPQQPAPLMPFTIPTPGTPWPKDYPFQVTCNTDMPNVPQTPTTVWF